jgi:transposase
MAYSIDLRVRVIDYVKQGNTHEKTSEVFKVGTATIERWLVLLSETGSLEKRPLSRTAPKFDSENLNSYIEENSDATLRDVAQHFEGSITGAFHALKREKITLKKKSLFTRKEMRRNAKNLKKS